MWAWAKFFLNPMNWAKIFSVLSTIWGLAQASILYFYKRSQNKNIEEIRRLEEALAAANRIAEDEVRLKKKAELICEMEKKRNPNSDCDI